MAEREGLAPCPFCGGAAELVDAGYTGGLHQRARCGMCHIETARYEALAGAAARVWNRRALSPAVSALVEAAEAADLPVYEVTRIATMAEQCKEMVGDGRWGLRECRRPFKTDEQREAGLCGIHLAAKLKRQKNDAAFKQAREDAQASERQAFALCDRIKRETGIDASPLYVTGARGRIGHYDAERVVVSGEALLAALSPDPPAREAGCGCRTGAPCCMSIADDPECDVEPWIVCGTCGHQARCHRTAEPAEGVKTMTCHCGTTVDSDDEELMVEGGHFCCPSCGTWLDEAAEPAEGGEG